MGGTLLRLVRRQPTGGAARRLGRRAQVELLYGLQCAADAERTTPVDSVQRAAQLLRAQDAPTIVDLPDECVRRVPLLASSVTGSAWR